jgi:hypothetical protein
MRSSLSFVMVDHPSRAANLGSNATKCDDAGVATRWKGVTKRVVLNPGSRRFRAASRTRLSPGRPAGRASSAIVYPFSVALILQEISLYAKKVATGTKR